MKLVSHSVEQTLALGRLIGRLAPAAPAVTSIALNGQLGAGKTHLTRGIAEGAGVADPTLVCSPTYVILNIYDGPKAVYHMDAYRVHSTEDMAAAGLEELLAGKGDGGVVVVEWASKVEGLLPSDSLHITMEHEGEADSPSRSLTLTANGETSQVLLDAIETTWRAEQKN